MDLEAGDEIAQTLSPQARAQLIDRRGDGLGKRLRTAVALTDDARALVLLGEVGEVEVDGEGARDELRTLELPGSDEPFGLALEASVLAAADDQRAQALDVAQEIRAAVVRDDPAERVAEQAYVAPQLGRNLLAGGLSSWTRFGQPRTRASREAPAARPR